MNKHELWKSIQSLDYKGSYNYEKENGFKQCKDKVLELIGQLDEQGLTFEAYNLFRQQTNDITAVYTELFKVQNELFNANKQIRTMEAQQQHYERLRMEEIEDIRRNALFEFLDELRKSQSADNSVVGVKGVMDFADIEKILSEKFQIEFPKNS